MRALKLVDLTKPRGCRSSAPSRFRKPEIQTFKENIEINTSRKVVLGQSSVHWLLIGVVNTSHRILSKTDLVPSCEPWKLVWPRRKKPPRFNYEHWAPTTMIKIQIISLFAQGSVSRISCSKDFPNRITCRTKFAFIFVCSMTVKHYGLVDEPNKCCLMLSHYIAACLPLDVSTIGIPKSITWTNFGWMDKWVTWKIQSNLHFITNHYMTTVTAWMYMGMSPSNAGFEEGSYTNRWGNIGSEFWIADDSYSCRPKEGWNGNIRARQRFRIFVVFKQQLSQWHL